MGSIVDPNTNEIELYTKANQFETGETGLIIFTRKPLKKMAES